MDGKLERFNAVNGKDAMATMPMPMPLENNASRRIGIGIDVTLEWDTSMNARYDRHVEPGVIRQLTAGEVGCALSHVSLWRQLVESEDDHSMLILEDDAAFLADKHSHSHSHSRRQPSGDRFLRAFKQAWTMLPNDWDIFYLGISDRGTRHDTIIQEGNNDDDPDLSVEIFRPTYGFHTHAYAIKRSAALRLMNELPVRGPVDVWLADNSWFGMNVYCAIVANEGYKNTGANLVHQDRYTSKGQSDIVQSGKRG